MCCGNLNAQVDVNASSEFVVMTYNILSSSSKLKEHPWDKRKDKVIKILKSGRADLIALQEVENSQYHQITDAMRDYDAYGVGKVDGKIAGSRNIILYRKERYKPIKSGTFWLSEKPNEVGSRGWDSRIIRTAGYVVLNDLQVNRNILVLCVHLDHLSAKARLESVKLIQKLMSEIADQYRSDAILLMGDFNATAHSDVIKRLVCKDLESDAFYSTHRQCGKTKYLGTYHGYGSKQKPKQIDYIFSTKSLKALSHRVVKTPSAYVGSDHFAVSARLKWAVE
ncbi:endonuclease/exonuclease/phosphatase family protein [Planctomycetota bacterium]|nr:endonuclease/exonuclease/phosphatase family protein [Planctomycetota bacterium]